MKHQRGNILFLILLAVVLFAALAYAVTSSLRGGGQDASKETVQAGAAAINNYVALIRNEVTRLMLVNGCNVENIDWRTSFYKRYNGNPAYNNNAAPPIPKAGCVLFQAYGGSIAPQTFEKYKDSVYETYMLANGVTSMVAGHLVLRWVNRKNELTDRNEISILWNGLNPAVCSYLLNPATSPALPNDAWYASDDINIGEQATYTTAANIIDDPVNLTGDFYARYITAGSITYCSLGATILPQ